MLRAILNKSWMQYPTKQKLYGHLPPISKTIQIRQTRHARHYCRSKAGLISDVFQWTPSHRRVGFWRRPAKTYLQQFCAYKGCSLVDLSEAMDNRDEWRERVREIRASDMTWWWWWYLIRCINAAELSYFPYYLWNFTWKIDLVSHPSGLEELVNMYYQFYYMIWFRFVRFYSI